MDGIRQIEKDMKEQNDPFNISDLPEKWAIDQVEADYKDRVLILGTSLDYNREARSLWENVIELYERDKKYFDSTDGYTIDDLKNVFEDIGFRYFNKDAKGWYKNLEIINSYGSVQDMLEEANYDAIELEQEIKNAGFYFLKGPKLLPFYIKILDMYLHDIDNVWKLEIPVDTWIRKITKEINGKDMTDDEIREFWRKLEKEEDISIMTVDTGLWLIGNNFNEWGSDYLKNVLNTDNFNYL